MEGSGELTRVSVSVLRDGSVLDDAELPGPEDLLMNDFVFSESDEDAFGRE